MEARNLSVGKERCQLNEPLRVNIPEMDMPPEILAEINKLLIEHGLKVENKYTGGLCGLGGTYTCWIEKTQSD